MLKKALQYYRLGKLIYNANKQQRLRDRIVVPDQTELAALKEVIDLAVIDPSLKKVADALFLNNEKYFPKHYGQSRESASWLWQRDIYPWPENGPYPPELILIYCEGLEARLGIKPIKERA